MRKLILLLLIFLGLVGCATIITHPPQWSSINDKIEAEYVPYFSGGTGSVIGQAFLTQAGGGVVKAAGRTVTLDPATTVGNEWWAKAGKFWVHRYITPPSPNFQKARKSTIADADGKFKFSNLSAGKYYVRTEVTWETGGNYPTQGGLVGDMVEVQKDKVTEVILSKYPQ